MILKVWRTTFSVVRLDIWWSRSEHTSNDLSYIEDGLEMDFGLNVRGCNRILATSANKFSPVDLICLPRAGEPRVALKGSRSRRCEVPPKPEC